LDFSKGSLDGGFSLRGDAKGKKETGQRPKPGKVNLLLLIKIKGLQGKKQMGQRELFGFFKWGGRSAEKNHTCLSHITKNSQESFISGEKSMQIDDLAL